MTTPTTTTTTPDQNEWAGLKNAASNGYLQFDRQDAITAANAAQQLVADLQAMAKAVSDNKLDRMDPFGNLYSGRELAGAFSTKAARLHDILQKNAKIVGDMHDTFVLAGKTYQLAEDGSSQQIGGSVQPSNLNMPTHSDLQTPELGGIDWGLDFKMPDFPSSLTDYHGNKDSSVTVMYENKDSLSYQDLYQLGQTIRPQPVADAAGMWKWLGETLYQKLNDFASTISSVSNHWEGTAASAAVAATQRYQQGVQPLTDAMTAMSQNLDYTARWLYATALSMPHNPKPDSCCPGKQMAHFRGEFESHYIAGIKNSVSVMPSLDAPTQQNQGNGNGQNPDGTGDGQNGNGQYGNGQNQSPEYQSGYQAGYQAGQQAGYGQNGQYGNSGQYGNYDPYGNGYGGENGYGSSNGYGTGGQYGSGNGQYGPGNSYGTGQYGDGSGYGSTGSGQYGYGTGQYGQGQGQGQGDYQQGYQAGYEKGYQDASGGTTGSSGTGSSPGVPMPQFGNSDPQGSGGSGSSSSPGSASGPGSSGSPSASIPSDYSSGSGDYGQSSPMPAAPTFSTPDFGSPSPSGRSGSRSGGGSSKSPSGGQSTPSLDDVISRLSGGGDTGTSAPMPDVPTTGGSTSSKTPSFGGGNSGSSGRGSSGSASAPSSNIPSLDDLVSGLSGSTGSEVPMPDAPTTGGTSGTHVPAFGSTDSGTTGHATSSHSPFGTESASDRGNPIESLFSGGQGTTGQGDPIESLLSAGQEALGQLGESLNKGIEAFTNLGASLGGLDELHHLAGQIPDLGQQLSDLTGGAFDPNALGGGGGGGGGGDVGGGDVPQTPQQPYENTRAAQLFPRAELPGTPALDAAHGDSPGMGAPGMAGAPAGGAGGAASSREHRRAKFLQSRENMDEALGDMPYKVKPVIE
ncbi:WXG100 family type VII secretion target [Nocardia sp. NPDC004068]|uniref:WXG100 family type VII secretion target n=1 Tax=Nocardia sp. NPDC004068 TaxID=3364303 RepID=UPI0036738295